MGKKPRQWSPDGLKYLMIINPFGWRNPPDGNSRNVAPGHLVSWVNHALGHREDDLVVQELAWRAKTGTKEAILVGIDESVDIQSLLGEHQWSEFCTNLKRPDSSYIFETKYGSLTHACGADSWKRVESNLQPASVGDMFKKPYPKPHWADSRKHCVEMNVQVSAQVKTIQALPQLAPQDIKPDPSVPQPSLISTSVFGPSEFGNGPQRPSRPAYTGLMPPTTVRTPEVAQGVYPTPRGMSSQGSSYVKQEPLENLVHSEVNAPGSIPDLPKSSSTQVLFSTKTEQSGNRHSVPPHGAGDSSTSVPGVPGSGREEEVPLRPGASAEVPAPSIKLEVSEGSVASVERTTAAYAAYLDRRSATNASIPTAAITRTPSPPPRSAQPSSSTPFPAGVPRFSNVPETPTTHVKSEPLEHAFEPVPPNPLEHVVSVNLSSLADSLPGGKYERTATLPSSYITRPGPPSAPEQLNRFSVKAAPSIPLTDPAPPVARSGTSPLTDRHNQPQGTSINVTDLPSPKRESGIEDRSAIYGLLSPSRTLNKRKCSSTNDRDREGKRARLDGSTR